MIHDGTVIDCGLPIELPIETIRRMACVAEITPIIVGADGVTLYLGQTTRLANRAQRRALRAMYRGCAVPGCSVAWDYVIIHHLKYFSHGGPTDIENLCRCATNITTTPTKAAGNSNCQPTAPSPSPTPMAPPNATAHRRHSPHAAAMTRSTLPLRRTDCSSGRKNGETLSRTLQAWMKP